MFNYDCGLITDEECGFFLYHSSTKTWLITWPDTLSQLGGWVSMSRVSGEGDVVTMSEGQWNGIPRSEEAALSQLPVEMTLMLCHVHIYIQACIFPRNFWTQGSVSTELDGGKVQIPVIRSNHPVKIGGCRKERDLILLSERTGGSESLLLIEQWRIDTVEELKKNPPLRRKCSWRFIFLDKHHWPVKTCICGKPGLLNYGAAWLVQCATPELCSCRRPCHTVEFQAELIIHFCKKLARLIQGWPMAFWGSFDWPFLQGLKMSVCHNQNVVSFHCNQNTFLLPKI